MQFVQQFFESSPHISSLSIGTLTEMCSSSPMEDFLGRPGMSEREPAVSVAGRRGQIALAVSANNSATGAIFCNHGGGE